MVLTSLMPLITHGIKACYDRHTLSFQPECPARLQSKHMTPCQAYNRDSSLCTTGHCFIASFFARHVLRTVHTELKWWHSFFLNFFEGHQFFCGTTDTPFLDFWWHLPWVSKPGLDPLTCILHCLHAMESSDSPLVWHLLTSWWPGWQPSCSWHSDMANQIYSVTYSAIMMNRSNGFYWMDWNSLRSCVPAAIACFFS